MEQHMETLYEMKTGGSLKKYDIIILILTILITYLISISTRLEILATFLALPAIYILPGLLLILLVSKDEIDLKYLVIMSFFLSTLIIVLVVSIFVFLNLTLVPHIIVFYVFLTSVLLIISQIKNVFTKIVSSKMDRLLIVLAFITYFVLILVFVHIPRTFSQDETTYMAYSRYINLNGMVVPVKSRGNFLIDLIIGRIFWILLITSFLSFTGLEIYYGYLVSLMFMVMIGFLSILLIPNACKNDKLLQIFVFLAVVSTPYLLFFAGFSLNDIAVSFYTCLAMLFFVKAFNNQDNTVVVIRFQHLTMSLLLIIISLLIKELAIYLYFIMCFGLVILRTKYRYCLKNRKSKLLFYILIAPPLVYELLVDIPFVVLGYVFKSEFAFTVIKKFLIISPLSKIIDLFDLFEFRNRIEYLSYLYRMISPEGLGLITSSVALILPLLVKLKLFGENLGNRLLIYLTSIALWSLYLIFFTQKIFADIPRYSLFLTPILVTTSVVFVYHIFAFNEHIGIKIGIILPMHVLLLINSVLAEKGELYIGYEVSKTKGTIIILTLYLLLFTFLIFLLTLKIASLTLKTRSAKHVLKIRINVRKILIIASMALILSVNIYFSSYLINNSIYYSDKNIDDIGNLINRYWSGNQLVITNVYRYARLYVSDKLFYNNYLLTLPITEDEFLKLLRLLPNGTLLLLGDQSIATKEYACRDGYIFKYLGISKIPLNLKPERQVYADRVLDLRFDNITSIIDQDLDSSGYDVVVVGNITSKDGIYGKSIFLMNGSYIRIIHPPLDYSRGITVEAIVNPVNLSEHYRVIVSQGWNTTGSWVLQSTPKGRWQFVIRNNEGKFFYVEGGQIIPGKWYHLVGVWEKSTLRLYINGTLYGPTTTSGSIESSYDILIGNCEKLRETNNWIGYVDEVRIYNRALSESEILDMYEGAKTLARSEHFTVLAVDSDKTLRKVVAEKSKVKVKSINVWWSNSTNVRVEIKISSFVEEDIYIFISTQRFLKIVNHRLSLGENDILLDFPHVLNNGLSYGTTISQTSFTIIVMDDEGNLFYNELYSKAKVGTIGLILWLIILASMLFLTLEITAKKLKI